MKKLILFLAAAIFTIGSLNAQDMSVATDTYNSGAASLQMGDNSGALFAFQEALKLGEACGEEGTDLVNNCKDIIPKVTLAIAKDYLKAEKYDDAVKQLNLAIEVAKSYNNNPDVISSATALLPQVAMSKATSLLKAKNYAAAAEEYGKITAADPTNGIAYLRQGMALAAQGKIAETETAYLAAAANGQDKAAKKQLSTLFLKLAASNLKAKKYNDAVANSDKSFEYLPNATAMKIAGTASSSLKNSTAAIKYLEKYLELSPKAKDYAAMCYTIAVTAQGAGDKAKAITYYKKITSDPKFSATALAQLKSLGQ